MIGDMSYTLIIARGLSSTNSRNIATRAANPRARVEWVAEKRYVLHSSTHFRQEHSVLRAQRRSDCLTSQQWLVGIHKQTPGPGCLPNAACEGSTGS